MESLSPGTNSPTTIRSQGTSGGSVAIGFILTKSTDDGNSSPVYQTIRNAVDTTETYEDERTAVPAESPYEDGPDLTPFLNEFSNNLRLSSHFHDVIVESFFLDLLFPS
jgi:hypothetical protein